MVGRAAYGDPWPFHCRISGMNLMLDTELRDTPAWHEEKIRYFDEAVQLTAEDRNYAQFPPEVEFPYAVTELWGGMGIAEQQSDTRNRYSHAKYADCSGGYPIKGPLMNSQSAIAAPITNCVDFNGQLYAAAGRYLYKRADDTPTGWTQVEDFGVGRVIGKMAVFQGTQSTAFLHIPLGTGEVFQTMDTAENFTPHASQKASGFERVGNELWLWTTETNGTRTIRKAEDGGVAITFGAPTTLGDSPEPITWLLSVADRLMGFKTNGIFAPTQADESIDEELAQEFRQLAASDNGVGAIAWDDNAVFRFGGGLYRFDPTTGQLQQFGPELLEDNDSDVKGEVKAIAGQAGLCLWAVVYNADTADSHLLKFGSHHQIDTPDGPVKTFVRSWHGALFSWEDRQVTSMHLTTVIGSKPRVYVFFSDGTIEWFKAARSASPLDDPDYQYDTAHTGRVYYPRYTALFPFEKKLIKGIGLGGRHLAGGVRTIGAEYKHAVDAAYTVLGSTGTEPGERLNILNQPAGNAFDFVATLTTTDTDSTPVLTAYVVYAALRTENLKRITAAIQCRDRVVALDGRVVRQSWQDIRSHIENAMTTDGTITVVNPAGETITVIGVNFGHTFLGTEQEGKSPIWMNTIDMVQTRTLASRGTWERASAFTWGDLAQFTWGEVRSI